MTRALTMMNQTGDTTITWTEEADAKMEAIIKKKMEEGITFFIIEPRAFGLLPPRKTELVDAADARKHRALSIPDEDLTAFVETGSGDLVKTPRARVKTKRISRDAAEVAANQSVGVQQLKGG